MLLNLHMDTFALTMTRTILTVCTGERTWYPYPYLPRELIWYILDCFAAGYLESTGHERAISRRRRRANKRELSACALICREWSNSIQAHLFRSLIIRDYADFDGLVNIIQRNPSLRTLVRRLELRQRTLPWIHRAFLTIPKLLTRLNTLCLASAAEDSPFWTNLPGRGYDFVRVAARQLHTVTALEIEGHSFNSCLTFLKFAQSFPSLITLRCREIEWRKRVHILPPHRILNGKWMGLWETVKDSPLDVEVSPCLFPRSLFLN